MRKFATTVARGSGCSKDDTDCRARWKSHRRQQDQYANVTIPYVDAKVAAALCRGGPVAYIHTEGSGITDDWILQYVVPATRQKLSREVCIVLGRALLWRIFDESGSFIPDEIKSRVRNAYNNLGDQCTLENGVNPIKKIPLGIGGNDAEVVIDELFTDEGDEAVEDQARRVRRRIEKQEITLLSSHVLHLRRDILDLKAQLERRDQQIAHMMNKVNRNLQHVAGTPGRRIVIAASESNSGHHDDSQNPNPQLVAMLSPLPKTLHDLWQEYEFGSGNRKPAKDFTPTERGKVKHSYYKRKFLWEKVSEMVRSGMIAQEACNKIYEVYGQNLSVTQILNQMKRDKLDRGGHPALSTLSNAV